MIFGAELYALGDPFGVIEAAEDERLAELTVIDQVLCDLVIGVDAEIERGAVAPAGTPLWHPQKDDFAPRLGLAWQVHSNLVLRAGAGIFYDLGYADVTNASISFPYVQQSFLFGTSFPLTGSSAAPPPFTTTPPAASMSVVDPNHVLPRTYEWNAAAEQSFSRADVLTLTYVGAAGRKLMRRICLVTESKLHGQI